MHRLKSADFDHPRPSEITPRGLVLQRRDWMRQLAAGSAGAALALWAGREALAQARRPRVRASCRRCPPRAAASPAP